MLFVRMFTPFCPLFWAPFSAKACHRIRACSTSPLFSRCFAVEDSPAAPPKASFACTPSRSFYSAPNIYAGFITFPGLRLSRYGAFPSGKPSFWQAFCGKQALLGAHYHGKACEGRSIKKAGRALRNYISSALILDKALGSGPRGSGRTCDL